MKKSDNNKRSKFLQTQLPLVAILIVAVCVYVAHSYQSSVSTDTDIISGLKSSCTFSNKTCEFLIDGELAVARFSSQPMPEESITLSLRMPNDEIIESAWIEGVNMYMGKVPVLLEQSVKGEWSGWFMLGSCSEPVMTWQLRLNIKKQAAPSYLYFTTES
jgi:hypothetical protein